MNTLNNTLNGLRPNPIVPIGSDDPEPLFVIRQKMLYLHQDLLDGMHEFFPPSTDFTLCGQPITPNWGKESAIYPRYRGNTLPKTDDNYAIEDAKWLAGVYMGELGKRRKNYISMISLRDRDYEVLKPENSPQETVIKIVHGSPSININTYKVVNEGKMKYRLNRDGYRICYECEEEKELTVENFYADKSKGKGFQHICIKCVQKKRHDKYHNKETKIK